ncbi:MAG: hypothetical protein WCR72_10700 [Bacteroidota bacterium]
MTGTSFAPMMIIIVIVIRRRKIIDRFRNTGTLSANTAKTAAELQIRQSLLFNRLCRRGILIENSGRYYLDEQRLSDSRYRTRSTILPLLVIVFLLLILADLYFTR